MARILNLPNLVQVTPEVHCGRVLAKPGQVPSQEHLAPLDLGCLFMKIFIVRLVLIDCCACVESSRCDVILEKFFVDQVDHCRNQLLDKFIAGYQRFDVA